MEDTPFIIIIIVAVLIWIVVIVIKDRWLKWRFPLLIGCTAFFLVDAFVHHESNSRFFALICFLLILQNHKKLKEKSKEQSQT